MTTEWMPHGVHVSKIRGPLYSSDAGKPLSESESEKMGEGRERETSGGEGGGGRRNETVMADDTNAMDMATAASGFEFPCPELDETPQDCDVSPSPASIIRNIVSEVR